jgi:CoA:oxalate CoA-transferase
MILSDLGAETIKVEMVGTGDRSREMEPRIDEMSTYFFSLNRGKKSIALDLRAEKGKKVFLELVKVVDVVTENFTPGTMDKLGLGYHTLSAQNPRLIYACCSGFGQTGPYAETKKPALDMVVQGMGGIMSITGPKGGPPCRVGSSVGDITAGMFFAIGILASLAERERSGRGQMADISMLDCQAALLENAFVRHFATGEVPQMLGASHPVTEPHGAYPTKDGYIVLCATGSVEQWALFLEKIGRLDLLSEERFLDRGTRYLYRDELTPLIAEALGKRTTREWIEEFESAGIPCGPLNTIADAAHDPQLLSRNMFIDLPCPGTQAGTMRVSNTPVRLSRTPAAVEKPAPNLGEHTREVLATLLGMSEQEILDLKKDKIIEMPSAQ